MEKQAYTVNEFVEVYGVGRTNTFEEIGNGRLLSYRVGRSRFISAHAASDWQRRLEAETAPLRDVPEPSADLEQVNAEQVGATS
jgi:hypothetical protein